MSKSLEVKQIIKKIDKADREIAAQRRNIRAEMSGVASWWKGNASKAFLDKYNEIDYGIATLERRVDELRNNADRLRKLLEEEERESKLLAKKLKG